MSVSIKDESITQMPKDVEAIKILLEGAEIDYSEDETDDGQKFFELDNGVMFWFDDDGTLVEVTS